MNIFLQIFLYIDVFAIGVFAVIGYRHFYTHMHPPKTSPKRPGSDNQVPQAVREKLLEQSSERFQHIIDKSAQQLEHELEATGERINTTVKKLAADIITKELEGFQDLFKHYQEETSKELETSKSGTEQYREELKAKIAEDIEREKQLMLELVDTKLADTVISFLTETLQHEVDLGAQMPYLLSQLESHKDELKKAVSDES